MLIVSYEDRRLYAANYYRPPVRPAPPKRKHRGLFLLLALALVGAGSLYVVAKHATANDSGQATSRSQSERKAAQDQLTAALTSDWQSVINSRKGDIQIAVYDRKTGATAISGNTDNTFNTASIMKVSILEALLLQDQQHGTGLTSSQLAKARPMIQNSDNNAATALWNELGGTSALKRFFQNLGATATIMNSDGHWGLTQTTAVDQLKVVNAFAYPDGPLSADSARQIDTLLDHVEFDQRWGVSGGVPSTATVELKNGWLNDTNGWDVNSIGHVHGGGADYTIAVLTNDNPSEQYGITTVEQLSAKTWETLAKT